MLANREFELKLALSEEDFKRLIAHPKLCDPQLERSEKVLKSIYYDTPDLRLRDLGMVLRVRDNGAGSSRPSKRTPDLRMGFPTR